MAGRGPVAAEQRARRNAPELGDWQSPPGHGWQHGDIPSPPSKLTKASREAWQAWFTSWWASYWSPEDVHGLRQVIRLFDKCERGDANSSDLNSLRQFLDNFGISPAGRQQRRWKMPETSDSDEFAADTVADGDDPYDGLKVLPGGA